MKLLHLFILIAIAFVLMGCPLENERPLKEIVAYDIPELPESVIQIPLVLKSRHLKRAFYQQFPNPLLSGETDEYKMKLQGKEKKEEDRNLLDRIADPLLGWVDKTFYVSSKVAYEVDLYSYDFWFEKDKFFSDIMLDLRTEVRLKNGITVFGQNAKLDGSLNCPMQVRMVLEGKIDLNNDASIKILLNEEDAKIIFRKVCSSNAIKGVDMPKLIEPILEPLKKRISQSINTMIAGQLQEMLDNNNEHLSFKAKIDSAAMQLGKPYEMMEDIWLVPNVTEVFVSPINGTGEGFANQLEITIGAKAKPQVILSQEKPLVNVPKEVSFAVDNYKAGTNIYVNASVPLDYAAKELQTYLKDYVDNNYAKHGYTIGETSLYSSQKKVVVAIDVLKANSLKKKASLFLSGIPKYDTLTQEIYLDELAFTAKSKNILLQFAKWFAQPKIMKQLKTYTRFGLSEQLKELQQQLNDFKLEEAMGTLKGKFNYVNISEVFVNDTDFEVYLQAQGNLDFDIKW